MDPDHLNARQSAEANILAGRDTPGRRFILRVYKKKLEDDRTYQLPPHVAFYADEIKQVELPVLPKDHLMANSSSVRQK